jgi:hypothetical protein
MWLSKVRVILFLGDDFHLLFRRELKPSVGSLSSLSRPLSSTPTKSSTSFSCNCIQSSWPKQSLRIPGSKCLVHFLSLRSFHRICPGPRLCVTICNKLDFYDEKAIAPRSTPKLDDHPFSAVHYCLFYIFAATLTLNFYVPRKFTPFLQDTFSTKVPYNPCHIFFYLFHLFTLHVLYSVD